MKMTLKTLKTMKTMRGCLLAFAVVLAAIAAACFARGEAALALSHLLWAGCEVLVYITTKAVDDRHSSYLKMLAFITNIAAITSSGKRAVIEEDKDGKLALSSAEKQDKPCTEA